MAFVRSVVATLAVAAFVGRVHVRANEVPLPPCSGSYTPFAYSGCFTDSGSSNALTFRSPLDTQSMTVEKCTAECKGNGYRYAGLEYYGECFCGSAIGGSAVPESKCSFSCTGNSTQKCGGSSIISVYQDNTFPSAGGVTAADYAPLGCYTDNSSKGKALTSRQDQLDTGSLTTAKCLEACKNGGFPYAGTEYGGECYCGVVIRDDTAAVPAADCNKPCSGAPGEKCGGNSRLTVYVADKLRSSQPCGYNPPPPPPPPPSSTPCPESSTSKPPPPPPPPSSTPCPESSNTKTTSTICYATTTVAPTCEYRCGNWCASPLPNWGDVSGCKAGYSQCKLQVNACYKNAGWPAAMECSDYDSWCSSVNGYCGGGGTNGKCSKSDFWGKKPGKGSSPPKTTVITVPCKPTPTPTPSSTKCPIPTPTNICKQPTNNQYGYAPGKPVGGIDLPVLTCNNLAKDFGSGPFKLYTDSDSSKCKSYPRNQCTNACVDACKEQLNDCKAVYVKGCSGGVPGGNGHSYGGRGGSGHGSYFHWARADDLERRTYGWTDSSSAASNKCTQQYNDCVAVNKGSNGAGKCPSFGTY
ncbi:WSC domain-containing protein [Lasiosphaeria miniovina]|uniref:WSC domain-containing protein n=1 Tax=Lasiosphaeria miniovina TaxID=1954250 RepID=A0AA40A4P3_9PEZI|nr:WSC domain-containing protein [Lasiosphaeria miniovina]KAK0709123.1 WSC domain-containing protein [Lasiosphaeria miniovina]